MQDELIGLQGELKKTIVFITHDLDEALKLGDRIAIMKDGKIIQLGFPEEIIENPVDAYVEDFIRSISRTRILGAASIMDDPVVASQNQEPKEILDQLLAEKQRYSFIVDDDGKLEGVVALDDLSGLSSRPGYMASLVGESSVQDFLITEEPDFTKVYSDTPIDELVTLSAISDCPIAVVDDEDCLLGVVSRGDLLVSLAESQQAQKGTVVTYQG